MIIMAKTKKKRRMKVKDVLNTVSDIKTPTQKLKNEARKGWQ
jgi:hypothetical protein